MNLIEKLYYILLSLIDKESVTDESSQNGIPSEYIIASVFPDKETMDIALKIIDS